MALPSHAEMVREIASGKTQDLLDAATNAFKQAKSDTGIFTEDAVSCLEQAIKYYNLASQKPDLKGQPSSLATLHLQLGKAHGLRAMAEYSSGPMHRFEPSDEVVQHHLRAAAQFFEHYRENVGKQAAAPILLSTAMKMIDVCDNNVDAPRRRRSLAGSFASHMLGGEISGYTGTRLPRVKLNLYFARQCFLQAVRRLHGETSTLSPVFAELRRLCNSPALDAQDEDSLLSSWRRVQQELGNAGAYLAKAKIHLGLVDEHAEIKAEVDDLSQQMRFLFHRAIAICKLAAAANKQREVLIESGCFEMEGAFEVVDALREATGVADSLGASGFNMDGFEDVPNNPDLEVMCMSMHFLANMFASMGFKDKAKEMHIRVLRTGLSLDPTSVGIDEATEVLTSKHWWVESRRYVERAQREVVQAEDMARQEALTEIDSQVKALQAARNQCSKPNGEDDPRPLLKHLLATHPPKIDMDVALVEKVNGTGAIAKGTVMKFMTFYHPDKLNAFYQPNAAPRVEVLLFEEIQKALNSIYEKNWK